MFTDVFPSAIWPALLITAVVLFRIRAFIKFHDWVELSWGIAEMPLAVIFWVESIAPLEPINRVVLLRNATMLLFTVKLFYQMFINPRMRKIQ